MPALDAFHLHKLWDDELRHEDYVRIVETSREYREREELLGHEDNVMPSGTGLMESLEWMQRVSAMAHNYYVSAEMGALISAAAESLPEDEPFFADDLPTSAGLLTFPTGTMTLRTRTDEDGNDAVLPLAAMVWALAGHGQRTAIHVLNLVNRHAREVREALGADLNERRGPALIPMGEVMYLLDGNGSDTVGSSQMVRWLVTCLRFMGEPYADVSERGLPANIRRGLKGKVRMKDTRVTVIEYRRIDRHYEATGTREFSHRFLRRDHWRRQWFKTEAGEWAQKRIYIHATIVGDPSLPLVVRDHVNALVR